jgi:hypothetical protein
MNCLSRIAVIGMVLAGSQVLAVDLTNPSIINKKLIANCMTKRMLANRTLSYNDAKKACTDQLKAQNTDVASNPSTIRSLHPLTAASAPNLNH